jgi:hypothetical protein
MQIAEPLLLPAAFVQLFALLGGSHMQQVKSQPFPYYTETTLTPNLMWQVIQEAQLQHFGFIFYFGVKGEAIKTRVLSLSVISGKKNLYRIYCILASCSIRFTLNICSFVLQSNIYFLLFIIRRQATWRPQRQHKYSNTQIF